MQAYADATHVADRVRCFHTVTNLSKCVDEASGQEYWRVFGYSLDGQFVIRCDKVVLACGKNRCKTLKIEGEASEENIVYDVTQLKKFLDRTPLLPLGVAKEIDEFDCFATPTVPYLLEPECDRRVVIVGDGISAADAVLHCLNHDVPVVHVMRRSERQLRSVMLARLSASVYPEYARVFRLMTGKVTDPYYERINCGEVTSLKMPSIAVVRSPQGVEPIPFHVLAACIGRESSLSFFKNLDEFVDYQSVADRSLYAVGSLAGDHFVRYLVGGCLQVAQSLIHADV
ncbi:hypothetical protein L596_005471 [Steinernema carpocapsae]|uniref:FAD/NAD(P)-binding domain-containing protein n=1 Tax=Steinernema carpocapsae TaxID=34508 RepID=A0A4V6I8G4_STECR|nr:hypothetical protein L596_005471 [Steinernema carpocapsae]